LQVVAVALTLAACSGGSSGSAVPEGFITYRGQDYSIAYPPDWRVSEETGRSGAPLIDIFWS
jgi:hypothetical protein